MVAPQMKSEARSEAKVLLKSVSRRYMACSSNVDYKDRWTERVLYADSMRWNWLAACTGCRQVNSCFWKFMSCAFLLCNVAFLVAMSFLHDATSWQSGETDYAHAALYLGVEAVFLFFFITELRMRYRATLRTVPKVWFTEGDTCRQVLEDIPKHCSIFTESGWNIYDALTIFIGFIDSVVLNFVWQPGHRFLLLLLPVLQVLRFGRFFPELGTTMRGISGAMLQGRMYWAFMLLALMIYAFGVLSVNFFNLAFPTDPVREQMFDAVPSAMFTLFHFATLEDYTSTIRHFISVGTTEAYLVACSILGFIVVAHFALLNILTAILVDSILDILPKKSAARLASEKKQLVERLFKVCSDVDNDEDGLLTWDEFRAAKDTSWKEELKKLQISQMDVEKLFGIIDVSDCGKVASARFVHGLMRMLPGPPERRELLEMEYDMHRMWNMLASGQDQMQESLSHIFEELSTLREELGNKLRSDLKQSQAELLTDVRQMAKTCTAPQIRSCRRRPTGGKNLQSLVKAGKWVKTAAKTAAKQLAELPKQVERQLASSPPAFTDQLQQLQVSMDSMEAQFQSLRAAPRPAELGLSRAAEQEVRHALREECSSPPVPNVPDVPQEVGAAQIPAAGSHPKSEAFSVGPVSASSSLRDALRDTLRELAGGSEQRQEDFQAMRPLPPPAPSSPTYSRHTQTEVPRGPAVRREASPPLRTSAQWVEAQEWPLSEPERTSWGERRLPVELVGPPSASSDRRARVAYILSWIRFQRWASLPFDRLILKLEGIGIQLGTDEQDMLRHLLAFPGDIPRVLPT
ncbi:Catsper1 [Symbiodinium sp. CCMP2592]|nr:Catsper1 [Symbiodinium sp. CCMP2592]